MKRSGFIVIIFISCIIIYSYLNGWFEFRRNLDTPEKYLNHSKKYKNDYTKDSASISTQLYSFLKHHEESFYAKNYFEGTKLIIDTILYSPNYDKIALFVIVKSPAYSQLTSDYKNEYLYDGYCYFGFRKSNAFDLHWYENSFANFDYKSDISSALKTYYFREFALVKTSENKSIYNLNDVRFWSCDFWNTIQENINKKIEFENERKFHPENIYQPKK
jgi:hypothetical protein